MLGIVCEKAKVSLLTHRSEPSRCCLGQGPPPHPPHPSLEGFCLCCRVRGGSRRGEAGPAEGCGEGDRRRLLSGLQLVAGGTPAHPVPERPPLGRRQTVEAAAFIKECLTYFIVSVSPLQVIETLLFSTFVSWKVFFPLVRDDCNCTYTFMTGDAGRGLLGLGMPPPQRVNHLPPSLIFVPQVGQVRSC